MTNASPNDPQFSNTFWEVAARIADLAGVVSAIAALIAWG